MSPSPEISFNHLRDWCITMKRSVILSSDGSIEIFTPGIRTRGITPDVLRSSVHNDLPLARPSVSDNPFVQLITDAFDVLHDDNHVPAGYESLAAVLNRALDQAASGKGRERHARNGEPFDEQVMQDGARRFGVGALLFQAFKKSEESQRLPVDRAVNELLGAINYLAGAVIALEREATSAANDNQPQESASHG